MFSTRYFSNSYHYIPQTSDSFTKNLKSEGTSETTRKTHCVGSRIIRGVLASASAGEIAFAVFALSALGVSTAGIGLAAVAILFATFCIGCVIYDLTISKNPDCTYVPKKPQWITKNSF